MEETPWNCVVSCCCCSPLPRSTPPGFSSVAMVCWWPGSHSFEASDLVQLQHLVSKICRERRGGVRGKERREACTKPTHLELPLGEGGRVGGGRNALSEGVGAQKGWSATASWVARSSYTHMQRHFSGCKIRRKQRELKTLKKEETGRKWCFTVGGGGQRGGTRYNTHDTRDEIHTIHEI